MLFSHVKISSFREKTHLLFHWCLYNKKKSRVLIGSRNEEHPWVFTVLGRDSASRFATVLKDEILAVNEAAAPPLF